MNKNNNKGVIALLIVIIVILSVLCVLFATGTISFNTSKVVDNEKVQNNNENDLDNNSDISNGDSDVGQNNDSNDVGQNTDSNDVGNSSVILTNEDATKIVKEIMDKFYTEVFYGHKETYCGNYDNDDTYSTTAYSYYKSASYNNLNDLKKHLNTYMSSKLVDYMLGGNDIPKYEEKENKLYCLVRGRGGLVYNKDYSSYSVSNYTDSTITAIANVAAFSEGNSSNNLTATLEFEKINNIWVLSKYEEKR